MCSSDLDTVNGKFIKIIHLEKNSGNASYPRNVGIDNAKGKYIGFIDSDDLVEDNYIELILNKIDKEDYRQLVKEVMDFLDGKNIDIQENLSRKMQEASDNENFEQAIILRDRIKALTGIQAHANLEYSGLKSVDIIGIAFKDGYQNICEIGKERIISHLHRIAIRNRP